MNSGKKFEEDFKNSIPDDVWRHRIRDPAASFGGGGDTTRFSPKNEYDFLLYKYPQLYSFELKSTEQSSIPFQLNAESNANGGIKASQIQALHSAVKFKIKSGFILNYRRTNHTYFIDIATFLDFANATTKKSINEKDCLGMKHILVPQKLKKVRYKYDISVLIDGDNG